MSMEERTQPSDTGERRDIFLCHSHKDKPFVRRLAEDLDGLSISVWYDDWELRPGNSLHMCISDALGWSAYVGVVLSPDSVSSRWCQDELEQALTHEKRTDRNIILPLLYREVLIPAFLAGRLHVDFSHFPGGDVKDQVSDSDLRDDLAADLEDVDAIGPGYFIPLFKLAAFLHGIQGRIIDTYLADSPPHSYDDVRRILVDLLRPSSPDAQVVRKDAHNRIGRALKDVGVPEMEDLLKEIQGFQYPTLLVFVFPSWQVAGDAIMELPFAEKKLGPDVSDRRILYKIFAIRQTGEANVIMGGDMSARERGEAMERFSRSGRLRTAIYPKGDTFEEIK